MNRQSMNGGIPRRCLERGNSRNAQSESRTATTHTALRIRAASRAPAAAAGHHSNAKERKRSAYASTEERLYLLACRLGTTLLQRVDR